MRGSLLHMWGGFSALLLCVFRSPRAHPHGAANDSPAQKTEREASVSVPALGCGSPLKTGRLHGRPDEAIHVMVIIVDRRDPQPPVGALSRAQQGYPNSRPWRSPCGTRDHRLQLARRPITSGRKIRLSISTRLPDMPAGHSICSRISRRGSTPGAISVRINPS